MHSCNPNLIVYILTIIVWYLPRIEHSEMEGLDDKHLNKWSFCFQIIQKLFVNSLFPSGRLSKNGFTGLFALLDEFNDKLSNLIQ